MQKTRCVVVGMGYISKSMVRELARKRWYETVAVVDLREEALAAAQASLSLVDDALFTDLAAALEQVSADVVIINTPSELHFEQARLALHNGRHVLVAKPITNDFEQAVELVELADAKHLTLAVGQQMRYRRHYCTVKRFIEDGKLGPVELANFLNTKPRHSALNLTNIAQPALYEMSCHHFDSLMALVPDQIPERIACDGFQPSWSVYDGPCMVNALIRFSEGLHVLYHGGFFSQADNYELRIEGSRGVLRCRGVHMSNDTMTNEFAEPGGSFAPIDIDQDIPAVDPWGMFFDLWHDYLQGGTEPPFSGRNNLKVFALLSAGIDSINRGQPAPVEVATNPRYAAAFASLPATTRVPA